MLKRKASNRSEVRYSRVVIGVLLLFLFALIASRWEGDPSPRENNVNIRIEKQLQKTEIIVQPAEPKQPEPEQPELERIASILVASRDKWMYKQTHYGRCEGSVPNGIMQSGEECDSGEGCSATCTCKTGFVVKNPNSYVLSEGCRAYTAEELADFILLRQLDRDGLLVLKGALDEKAINQFDTEIKEASEKGWASGRDASGNVWYDDFLARRKEVFEPLLYHPRWVRLLTALVGDQLQVRDMRIHENPGSYTQGWHMDFFGYWGQQRVTRRHRYGVNAIAFNVACYLQDNNVGEAQLAFVKNGHLIEPPYLFPWEFPKFAEWCEASEKIVINARAGDCVLFYSHIPHQGRKFVDNKYRSNIVIHYQANPMHSNIWHVQTNITDGRFIHPVQF